VKSVEAIPAKEEIELSEIPAIVPAHPLKMVVEARIPASATGRITDSAFDSYEIRASLPPNRGDRFRRDS
jgi:hypothetical protein